jgi:altronate dehydratase
MGYASQRDYVPSGVLSEEEKAAIRAQHERVNGAKNDGFVPFDHMIGTSLKHGDTVRLHDAIVLAHPDTGGSLQIGIGGVVYTAVINSIAAVRRKPPEPLKVGDIVKHSVWHDGTTAEIAGIKDGLAAFWPIGTGYIPVPRPLGELERVK